MVELINVSYDEYIRKYGERQIILIGAGGTLSNFLSIHQDKYYLMSKISYILDNNKKLNGKEIQILNNRFEIKYLPDFSEKSVAEHYVIFILVSDGYVVNLLKQLDDISVFDGTPCIYGVGTFRWGYTYFPTPKYRINIEQNQSCDNKIPKIIHFCWFGKNDIPLKDIECIDSFYKLHPDYQIIKWSEENYDISKSPKYVQDAYVNKKYAFVSDYVRLWVLYQYGGIYLDTDVQLFERLDFVLKYRMMFAYMEYGEIATGLGVASEKGASVIKDLMDIYENIPFVFEDGSLNLTPCPRYTNEYFRRKGYILDNSLDVIDDILFLSSDYLCPMNPVECEDGSYQLAQLSLTDRTIGIHWCNNSWKDKKELCVFEKEKNDRKIINERLFEDWKRTRNKRKLSVLEY